VTGGWRKLHADELHDLHSSPSIVRKIKSRSMRWAGHKAQIEEKRNVYGLLVGKSEEKRPLGGPRRRWEDNIKINLGEIEWGGVNWIDLAKEKDKWISVMNSVMRLWVPQYARNFSNGPTTAP
jgi:hypothetical protein